ncbi:sulfite exporter TauE/SafE family protein [Thalassobacillus pellis]|uniref:sulfite exporter TauE/SafE family protein n=1 Tax=Thalassobacillus pellis TaxID=748008 RepID=UPI00195F67FD|nr:sulfite exporter TauE/SafE family protein [Thalassobacillus pellis]MBM7551337.1 putative membrane protein YfcA [Thalassobacillus pellis]
MRKLVIFALVGFFAQLIDGALGMSFGLSSSSLLIAYGLAPAVVSSSIHMSEIATTAVSGISHYKFGNLDKTLVLPLVVPGAISAFLGAAFLSSLPGEVIKPFISVFLLLLGIYIVVRFLSLRSTPESSKRSPLKKRFLYPLGAVAGFFDAVGGGGWGPINTPILLSQKGATPRKVIGTVDTSEFAITISATLGFLLFLGWEQFSWIWVLAFMIGGVIAAPIAAWLVRIVPSFILGVLAGGFIILTNVRTLLTTGNISNDVLTVIYAVLLLGWLAVIVTSIRKNIRFQRRRENTVN